MQTLVLLYIIICVLVAQALESKEVDRLSQTERLRERAKSLRAVADDLVVDARSLNDRTTALSEQARQIISNEGKTVPTETGNTRRLRQPCNSIECGSSCLKDCMSQCRVAKVLELPVVMCGRDYCARSCALGCTRDACGFRFVLDGGLI